MKRSSQSSSKRRRSTEEKEAWALRAVFNAMYGVGITVTNVEEAYQAIDLAAKLMTYALRRKVTPDEIKASMVKLIEEEIAASATKH